MYQTCSCSWRIILNYAPEASPTTWSAVNLFIIVYSLICLSIALFAGDGAPCKEFVNESYIMYNLITCTIWLTQVSLVILYKYYHLSDRQWDWSRMIEWFLSVFFFVDSLQMLILDDRGTSYRTSTIVDALFAIMVFSYELLANHMERKKHHEEGQYAEISATNADKNVHPEQII